MHMTPTRLADSLDASSARVAVLIPVRNEVATIARTIQCVLNQTIPPDRVEVLVLDGLSDDGTREVLARYHEDHARLRVIDNPSHTIPAALNLGIEATTADVIIRVDGRCHIEPNYIERCVELLAKSRAGNVGGLVRSQGQSPTGQAIALAMRSRFGIGNSRYHYLVREEYVDTVYMGAFPRHVLEQVGGYDEELIRNQDDELNYRIRRAGYGILLSPSIVSTYTPPNHLLHLWRRQFYQYGLWKVRVIQKHPGSLQARHLAPPTLVSGLVASILFGAVRRKRYLLAPVLLYGLAVVAAAIATAGRSVWLMPRLIAVFLCMHLGYGVGFWVGLWRAARQHIRPSR